MTTNTNQSNSNKQATNILITNPFDSTIKHKYFNTAPSSISSISSNNTNNNNNNNNISSKSSSSMSNHTVTNSPRSKSQHPILKMDSCDLR